MVVHPAGDPAEGRHTDAEPNGADQQNRACVTGKQEPGEDAHGRLSAGRGVVSQQTVLEGVRHERRLFIVRGAVVPPRAAPNRVAAVFLFTAELAITGRHKCSHRLVGVSTEHLELDQPGGSCLSQNVLLKFSRNVAIRGNASPGAHPPPRMGRDPGRRAPSCPNSASFPPVTHHICRSVSDAKLVQSCAKAPPSRG